VRDWVYQLIGQGVLAQVGHEYPVLKLNEVSWQVMKGEKSVRLIQLVRRKKGEKPEKSKAAEVSWEGVDQALFEALRLLRRGFAQQEQVPPYVIFNDASLPEMARPPPSTMERMGEIEGVGDVSWKQWGAAFLRAIRAHCGATGTVTDVSPPPRPAEPPPVQPPLKVSPREEKAFGLFREESAIEDVMHQM